MHRVVCLTEMLVGRWMTVFGRNRDVKRSGVEDLHGVDASDRMLHE